MYTQSFYKQNPSAEAFKKQTPKIAVMNPKINALIADFKYFLPRSLMWGLGLAFVTWFYLAFVCGDWSVDFFVFTFGSWVGLWTLTAICLLPTLLRN
jgi:hypothetical protein